MSRNSTEKMTMSYRPPARFDLSNTFKDDHALPVWSGAAPQPGPRAEFYDACSHQWKEDRT